MVMRPFFIALGPTTLLSTSRNIRKIRANSRISWKPESSERSFWGGLCLLDFQGLWGGASAQGFIGTFSTVFPTNQQEPNCLVLRFSIDESVKNRSRMADLQARKPSENLHS